MIKSKEQIDSDLKKNPDDDRYKFYKHVKGKSDVWANFELIMFEEAAQDFARCINCKSILKYNSKSGTASLLRHKCPLPFKTKSEKQPSLDKYAMKQLPASKKDQIIRKQLHFIARDLRPLSITDGKLFAFLLHFCWYF